MTIYAVRVGGTLGVTTTQLATIIAAAVRSFLITEIDFSGMGVTSASDEFGIYRVGTAGVTPSNALVFTALGAAPNTFQGTGFTTYATQPIAGALLHNCPLNANGARYFWRADQNLANAIEVPGGNNAAASIALFPISGSATIAGRLLIKEI